MKWDIKIKHNLYIVMALLMDSKFVKDLDSSNKHQ